MFKQQILSHPAVGFGTMELCFTADRPPFDDAVAMLESLVSDHGLTFIDTADSYCLSEKDFGYGNRLVSKFIGRKDVRIATKIGFKRDGGAWTRCGDPKYLRSACEGELKDLGVEQIPLCQFHTPDPKVPIEESLGEMIRLQAEGKIGEIGISNFYTVDELQRASSVAKIVSLQNPLSMLFYKPEDHDPVLRYCEDNGIIFLAYAPVGGHRNKGALEGIPEIASIAQKAGLSPYMLALLFLKSLSPAIVSIPGSVNKDHIIANLAANTMTLSKETETEITQLLTEE
ncbi:MAG: aldo/keto reductase [Candidatus Kapaibacterium sp.]